MSSRGKKKREEQIKVEGAILRQILLQFADYVMNEPEILEKVREPEHLVDNFIGSKTGESS